MSDSKSSDGSRNDDERMEELRSCFLQDRGDDGKRKRELVCEVGDDDWESAVSRPVDEVTFAPADDEDSRDSEDMLNLDQRVRETVTEMKQNGEI